MKTCIFLTALLLLSLVRSPGQATITPRDDVWYPDGPVSCALEYAGAVYIGGTFQYVGPHVGLGGVLDAVSGYRFPFWPKVEASSFFGPLNGEFITAVASDGADGWFVAGRFDKVGGNDRVGIAHIKSDGTVDTAWNSGGAYTVYAIAVSSTRVYIGGNFGSVGRESRSRIAALDKTTGMVTDWNPGVNGTVSALVISPDEGTVYAGGSFSAIGGQPRVNMAALDAGTGTATAWNPALSGGPIISLALSGTTLYAGNRQVNAIVTMVPASLLWSQTLGASGSAAALAVSGSTVYVGGFFNSVGTSTRMNLASLDAATGAPTAWNPSANSAVLALDVLPGALHVGGRFTQLAGQRRHRLAAFDLSSGALTPWDPAADGAVTSLAHDSLGDKIYAGGEFHSLGMEPRPSLAAFDLSTGQATTWKPELGPGLQTVNSMTRQGGKLYIGGSFQDVGGQLRKGLAAVDLGLPFDVRDWDPVGHLGLDHLLGFVETLGSAFGVVYNLGYSYTVPGTSTTRRRVSAFETFADIADLLPWNPEVVGNGIIRKMAVGINPTTVSVASIYLAGTFTNISGSERHDIAMVNSDGTVNPWSPNLNNIEPITALTVSPLNVVYAAGQFPFSSGPPLERVAAIDVTGAVTFFDTLATNVARRTSGGVNVLSADDHTLYLGGDFDRVAGQTRKGLAALSPLTGVVTPWNPSVTGQQPLYALNEVNAITPGTDYVYVAGSFGRINGRTHPNFALFPLFRLTITRVTATDYELCFPSDVGDTYRIERSTDMVTWTLVSTITATTRRVCYIERAGPGFVVFRAVRVP